MSDVPEGAGWWQASDGRWYPPDQFGATAAPVGAPPSAPDVLPLGRSAPPPPSAPPGAGPATAPPPPSMAAAMATEPGVLVTVGDIACTADTALTPGGRVPLARTVWVVQNNTTTTESIPTWAIVLAVLFVFACLLGLLFLLVKERKTTGWMTVSVQGDGAYYATQIPISSPEQVADVDGRVNYIRGLVAALG